MSEENLDQEGLVLGHGFVSQVNWDRWVLRASFCERVVLWAPLDCSILPLHKPGLTWRAGSLAGHSRFAALSPAARRWSPRVTGRREKGSQQSNTTQQH